MDGYALLATDLGPLPPSDRITDVVYDRLRAAILSSQLQAGSRLSVPALADALGVSRSPVREAIIRLINDRLVTEERRRGAMVAEIGLWELASLYEIREVLEGLAARLATEHRQPTFLAELQELLRYHEEGIASGAAERAFDADIAFHLAVRKATGNVVLVDLLDNIQTQVRLAMLTTSATAGPQLALEDHRLIYREINAGNTIGAEHAARKHVSRLRDSLLHQAVARENGVGQ